MKQLTLAICVLAFVFVFLTDIASAEPTIDCKAGTFTSGEKEDPPGSGKKKTNWRDPGDEMSWKIDADQDTEVEFEFSKKTGPSGGLGDSPMKNKKKKFARTIHTNGEVVYGGRIRAGTGSSGNKKRYHYKIKCILPNGEEKEIDPIIEVPKPPHIEEEN